MWCEGVVCCGGVMWFVGDIGGRGVVYWCGIQFHVSFFS